MKTKTFFLAALLAVMPLASCSGGGTSTTPASQSVEPSTSETPESTSPSVDPYIYTFDTIKITATNLQYDFQTIEKADTTKVKHFMYYKIGDNFMKVCEEETNKTTYYKKNGAKYKCWTSTKVPSQITAKEDWTASFDQEANVANGSLDILPSTMGKKYKLSSEKSASLKIVYDGTPDTSFQTKSYFNEDNASALYWVDGTDFAMPLMDYDANYRTIISQIDHRTSTFPTSVLPE